MKRNKFVYAVNNIVLALMITVLFACKNPLVMPVSATEATNKVNTELVAFESLSQNERDQRITALITALYSGNMSEMRKMAHLFTSSAYEDLTDYIATGSFGNGTITKLVTDYISVDNSSCGDYTAMVNMKITRSQLDYIYLLEFHFNAAGEIYGYNIWEY